MREIKFLIEVEGEWHPFTWKELNETILFGIDLSLNRKRQFTGLLDKNGKEIYEGDTFFHPVVNNVLCIVFFDQGAFGCKGEGVSQYLCYVNDKIEIIENERKEN